MKFMLLVKASKDSEAGVMPEDSLISAMTRFNEEMIAAGVLRDGSGLHPSSRGARVKFSPGGRVEVQEGPFASEDLVAGYWIIEVKSREEALEWARRSPNPQGPAGYGEIEVRQIFGVEDFAPSPAVEEAFKLEEKLRG